MDEEFKNDEFLLDDPEGADVPETDDEDEDEDEESDPTTPDETI